MAYVRFYHWSGRKRRQRGQRRQCTEYRKKDSGSGNWKKEEKKIDVHQLGDFKWFGRKEKNSQ